LEYKTYYLTHWFFVVIVFLFTIYTFFKSKELFSTILFFFILQASKPINDAFVKAIGFSFMGVYYLIPIVFFTVLIILFPSIRKTISWWSKEVFSIKAVVLSLALSIFSGIALYLWAKWFPTDQILNFSQQVPDGVWFMVFLNGFLFALLNSLVEEYLTRGMLCNGLLKIFDNVTLIILIQAVIFGISHYYGFPEGYIGVIMVFIWSIVLGIIRFMTKGLVGVWISHFTADFVIYFILYSLKF
jgi:uncharacterized protein